MRFILVRVVYVIREVRSTIELWLYDFEHECTRLSKDVTEYQDSKRDRS